MNDEPLGSRYVLGPLLGRGTTGRVHEGWRLADGERFAVKVLRDGWTEDAGILHCLIQEKRALAALDHPHVVEVVDLVIDGEQAGIVLEYVGGGTLRPLLADGPLPAGWVAGLGRQLALALEAAHDASVVHGDVKPDNVLVASIDPPVVKLGDFGIARLLGAAEWQVAAHGGTPSYMAPELVTGDPAGPAGDVYALGVLLYQALAGRPPFPAETPAEAWRAHTELAPPRPDGVGDAWWELLRRMLAKAPGARPSAAEVAAALAPGRTEPDLRQVGPPAEPPPPPAEETGRPWARRLAVGGAAAGVLLVTLGSLAWAGGRVPAAPVPPSQVTVEVGRATGSSWLTLAQAHPVTYAKACPLGASGTDARCGSWIPVADGGAWNELIAGVAPGERWQLYLKAEVAGQRP